MPLFRIALAAACVTAFGASTAMAECGYHQQSVQTESSVAASEGEAAQTPLPEGSLAVVPAETDAPATAQPRAAAAKSE